PQLLTKPGLDSTAQRMRSHHPALLAHGSEALQRAVSYSAAAAPAEEVAQRLVELADWYLLMDQHDEAAAHYQDAMQLLETAGLDSDQRSAVLQSGQPVRDPVRELSRELLGAESQ